MSEISQAEFSRFVQEAKEQCERADRLERDIEWIKAATLNNKDVHDTCAEEIARACSWNLEEEPKIVQALRVALGAMMLSRSAHTLKTKDDISFRGLMEAVRLSGFPEGSFTTEEAAKALFDPDYIGDTDGNG